MLRWSNEGDIKRRCARHLSPSLVSSPSPKAVPRMRTEQGLRVVRDVVEQDALDAGRIAHKKPVSRGKRFHEATLLFSLPDYCSDLAEIAILHPTRAVPLEKILVARIGLAPELLIAWSHWSNRAGEDLIDVTLCHFCLPKECRSALRGYSYKPPTTKHYA